MFQAIVFIYKKLQKANKCLKCLLFLYLLGTNIPRSNTQFPSSGGLGALDPAALSAILLAAGIAATQLNEGEGGEEEESSVCKPHICGTGKCVKINSKEHACICPHGTAYKDKTCKPDPCTGVNCGQGGKCVVTEWTKTCICPKGYVNIGESCKKACPKGTVEYDDKASKKRHCYFPVYTEQSWDSSRTKCKEKYSDADLADIPNQGANNLISGAFFNLGKDYWIGINDKGQSGTFQYLNPTTAIPPGKAITYNNWKAGSPTNGANEDCVHVQITDFKWDDVNCAGTKPALCSIILSD